MTNTHLTAATKPAGDKPFSWREAICNVLSTAMIAVAVANIFVVVDSRSVAEKQLRLIDLQITTTHQASLITENALAKLENREPSDAAKGVKVQPLEDRKDD